MGSNFQDSGRYATVHKSLNGPGDARPTALQIVHDNNLVGRMQDKVVLLTGGSNGIGVEEVRAFAMTGATVFFTSRDLAKGEKVKGDVLKAVEGDSAVTTPRVEVLHMELKSLESVRKGVEDFKRKSDRLDILVNNAGKWKSPFSSYDWYLQCHRHRDDTSRLHGRRL